MKPGGRRNKFNAKKQTIDGITFDSKAEATFYATLKIRQRAGEILDVLCHPPFPITAHGKKICTYKPDFTFYEVGQERIRYVDVKAPPTAQRRDFRLVKKLFEAQYQVELEIVF